jgi:hypothetical protein
LLVRPLALWLALPLAACAAPPAPAIAPLAVPPASSGAPQAAAPAAASPAPHGPWTVDGVTPGATVGALLAREPYRAPCDVDPIDHKRATLYFWAAGPCREAPPFPGGTSVVVVTARDPNAPPEQQPIEILGWAGGAYYEGKTNLPLHLGDTPERALAALGKPTAIRQTSEIRGGARVDTIAFSWGSVHAYAVKGAVVAIALGALDLGAEGERAQTLERLYAHHVRYAQREGGSP